MDKRVDEKKAGAKQSREEGPMPGATGPDASPYCVSDPTEFGRNMARVAGDRKSTRLNSSHVKRSRMPSSA